MKKTSNILLINPPMQVDRLPEVPPFGIFYVASELKKNGHKVEILDIDGYRYQKEKVKSIIEASSADIIGVGGLATVYPYLHWLVPEIRKIKSDIPIVLGGAIASSLREKCFLDFDIDFEVIGEGELTIKELIQEINNSKNFESVKGIAFKKNGKIIFTNTRPLMDNLENVPIFDDSFFPMNEYLKNSEGALQIHVQRGCPYSCSFCFNCYRVVSSRMRYRPYNNVIDEIEYFRNKYRNKIRFFALSGECLTANKGWIINFCKELMERKLKINYRVTSRVDTIDGETLEWLKKSGCVRMSLGLESGSDKILKIMKKRTTVLQNKKAVFLSKKYIKKIEASVILGYLGEDENTVRETVAFCKEIKTKPSTFFATPFPGTELYETAISQNRIKDVNKYLMSLDKANIAAYSINLTEMNDDEADGILKAAAKDIHCYYFFRAPWTIFTRIIVSIKKRGFIGVIKHVCGKIINK